jgi:anti-sigma B factor antagonist
MELNISHKEGCVLVRCLGSIDESAKPLFSEHVRPLFAEQGRKFVLDLSEANFITSAGIGNLAALAADANLRGSRVILAACSSFVSVVLARSKLDKFFEIAASVDEAIAL